MEAPVLLIADSNPEFREALGDLLQGCCRVHCCGTGTEAAELLQALRPQILVLDLMLPEIDGISLLHSAHEQGLRPKVLATTSLLSPYVMEKLLELGVAYLLRRPCDVHCAARRVEDLCRRVHDSDIGPQACLSGILRSLGFSGSHTGTRCLPIAVMLDAQDPGQAYTKELYPETGRLCDPPISGDQVEKLIRYAIEKAWARGNKAEWSRYFAPDQNGEFTKPSNGQFISRMTEVLKNWQNSGIR